MKTHRSLAASLLAALVLSPATGSAAPPAPPQGQPAAPPQATSPAPAQADAMSRAARDMFAKGEEAWMQGKYDQCHAWFLAAWSIRPHRQIAGNLAACELKVGRYRDAAEHLAFLTRPTPDGKPTPLSQEHRALLDEAMAKIAVLQIDAEPGTTVVLDGKIVGQAPLPAPLYLEPGEHTIEGRSHAGGLAQVPLTLAPGTQRNIDLHLQAPQPATTTPEPAQAPPRVAPPPPPPPDTRVRHGVVIGGLALGGAAIAAGVVLAVVSNGKSGEADDALHSIVKDGGINACNDPAFRARCDALADANTARRTTRDLAIAAFVTSGAALGGAALASLLWPVGAPREATSRGVRIVPTVTAQSAGLTFGGAF
ncbi:hypothetical protein WMF39_44380 [Sorangium sp. So ce1504]|uniref:hypothetical protein n=1 Tax=Sorangium sp. So ce1504 TaxID=3133337 RepID=UPI003F5EBC3E